MAVGREVSWDLEAGASVPLPGVVALPWGGHLPFQEGCFLTCQVGIVTPPAYCEDVV